MRWDKGEGRRNEGQRRGTMGEMSRETAGRDRGGEGQRVRGTGRGTQDEMGGRGRKGQGQGRGLWRGRRSKCMRGFPYVYVYVLAFLPLLAETTQDRLFWKISLFVRLIYSSAPSCCNV